MRKDLNIKEALKLLNYNHEQYNLKVCEELSELQTAYLHFLYNKVEKEDVIEELADVAIQFDKILFAISEFDTDELQSVKEQYDNVYQEKMIQLRSLIH